MISKATITPIYITITKLEIQIATFNFDTQLSRYLRRSSSSSKPVAISSIMAQAPAYLATASSYRPAASSTSAAPQWAFQMRVRMP